MLYGQRVGETYEHDGRYIHEVGTDFYYRTGRGGLGLWVIRAGPTAPGGWHEKQILGHSQFSAKSPADFRRLLGSWAHPLSGDDKEG